VQSGAADFQKRLGARVRQIRTSKGFSQESFAEACELHRTHVSLLERGKINITVNTARQIVHVLEISLSELFRGMGCWWRRKSVPFCRAERRRWCGFAMADCRRAARTLCL
jgi:DNA-binding XRE family transcriptional regulator